MIFRRGNFHKIYYYVHTYGVRYSHCYASKSSKRAAALKSEIFALPPWRFIFSERILQGTGSVRVVYAHYAVTICSSSSWYCFRPASSRHPERQQTTPICCCRSVNQNIINFNNILWFSYNSNIGFFLINIEIVQNSTRSRYCLETIDFFFFKKKFTISL